VSRTSPISTAGATLWPPSGPPSSASGDEEEEEEEKNEEQGEEDEEVFRGEEHEREGEEEAGAVVPASSLARVVRKRHARRACKTRCVRVPRHFYQHYTWPI